MKKIKAVKIEDATYAPKKNNGLVDLDLADIDGMLEEIEKRCSILLKMSGDQVWIDALKNIKNKVVSALSTYEAAADEMSTDMKVKE